MLIKVDGQLYLPPEIAEILTGFKEVSRYSNKIAIPINQEMLDRLSLILSLSYSLKPIDEIVSLLPTVTEEEKEEPKPVANNTSNDVITLMAGMMPALITSMANNSYNNGNNQSVAPNVSIQKKPKEEPKQIEKEQIVKGEVKSFEPKKKTGSLAELAKRAKGKIK